MAIGRKIIHIDCDCFYAAVELRDQPQLKGLPVAVGGTKSPRGVLSTCNYEARKFGIHSAMATSVALRLCPQLIILPHRFDVYRQASEQIKAIFYRFTDKVEPISLDEAFLDVSAIEDFQGSATLMAIAIRQAIEDEVGISASAGIAPNKFLAKVASDWQKPNGQFVIRPEDVDGFMPGLAVKKINGVGPSTMKKMARLQVHSCADLQQLELLKLVQHFGVFGQRLFDLCRGIDDRPVRSHRLRKSLSVEQTFSSDLLDIDACNAAMPAIIAKFHERLEKLTSDQQVYKQFIKIKFSDFTSTTMECMSQGICEQTFMRLLSQAHQRQALPVRLLGVGVGLREPPNHQQLLLFNDY